MSDNFTNTEAQALPESVNPMDKVPDELGSIGELNTLQDEYINCDEGTLQEAFRATRDEAYKGESLAGLSDIDLNNLSDDEGFLVQEDNVLDDDITRLENDEQRVGGYLPQSDMIELAKVVDSELKYKLAAEQDLQKNHSS